MSLCDRQNPLEEFPSVGWEGRGKSLDFRALPFELSLLYRSLGVLGLLANAAISLAAPAVADSLQPYPANPRYWQFQGRPVLLIGGSKDDNIFQISDLEEHLDGLKSAGGNLVRNTMSDRSDGEPLARAFKQLEDGRYDLEQWNEEYWNRFEELLRLASERQIVVQIEVWDRFDHSREYWELDPYNPKNNVNYTTEQTGLAEHYPEHPGKNRQPFFYTTPSLNNNQVLLRYQQAFVDELLSHTLRYNNVLFCIDNETSGDEAWGVYWTKYIQQKYDAEGRPVCITEMWDAWDLKSNEHKRTLDHSTRYRFVDVSQNNHNSGQQHWDNLQWVRQYLAGSPRPINSIKVYGASGSKFGNSNRHGIERFWRNVIGGAAAVRFHRPPSGLGLSEPAMTSIRSVRMLESVVPLWDVTPAQDLLSARSDNEAYSTANPGQAYVVYFPDGCLGSQFKWNFWGVYFVGLS